MHRSVRICFKFLTEITMVTILRITDVGRKRETILEANAENRKNRRVVRFQYILKRKRGFADGLDTKHEVMTQKIGRSKLPFTRTGQTAGRVVCCCFGSIGEQEFLLGHFSDVH